MRISSKQQFYRLWQAGVLGNRPRTWRTLTELQTSDYTGPVTLRYRGAAGGGMAITHIPARQVGSKVDEWVRAGLMGDRVTFHESMPDARLLIQGEAMRSERGLELTFSTRPSESMRDAMRSPQIVHGLRAKLILEHFLDANSLADLDLLLERYPEAVVEFGTYGQDVGVLPRRNTVIWEVRNY